MALRACINAWLPRGLMALCASTVAATVAAHPAAVRTPSLDVHHVAIDLRLDLSARRAQGTATLTVAPRSRSTRIHLDAGRLAIDSVTLGGRALAWTHDAGDADDNLRILLNRAYEPRERLTLRIAYRTAWINHSDPANIWGSSGKGLRFLRPSPTEPTRRLQVWAGGEPGGNRHWFPGYDAPGVLRTSEVRLTVPAPLTAVAGSELAGVTTNPDGTRTFHWRTRSPEPNHRTTFAVGQFTDVPQRAGGVSIHNLGYPDEVEGVRSSVVQAPDTLRFLEGLTGTPFPHRRYRQVFVQDLPWHTVGTGFAVQTENMIDDDGTHHDFQYLWDGLQTESLAQQWFGGRVAICDWSHVWLERALAHHAAALYTEHRHGRDEYLMWYVQANQATTLTDWSQGVRHPVVDAKPKDLASYVLGNAPAARGAAVLHALRQLVGDAKWRRALRDFAQNAPRPCARTEDLRRRVEAASGLRLGWFFDQWVHRAGHPVFEVTRTWHASSRRLELVLKQVQAQEATPADRRAAYFEGPLDIEIDGRVHRVQLAAQTENRFTFDLPQEPRYAHIDHGDGWIKELRDDGKTFDELLRQYEDTRDAATRQWAQRELMKRALSTDGKGLADAQKLSLSKALLRVAQRPAATTYWRVRFAALQQLAALHAPAQAGSPAGFDVTTTDALIDLIKQETTWVRAGATRALGLARDPRHAGLYASLLNDASDRVVNAAAMALGRSRSPLAYDALLALPAKPSWKNQSLISALNGLAELRDERGVTLAMKAITDESSARWTLATPVWDFRLAAADTLVALQHTQAPVPMLLKRFERALADDEVNDMFANVQLLVTLGAPEAERVFVPLRRRFAGDASALKVVEDWEALLAAKLKAAR